MFFMWNLITFFCMLFGGLVHFSFLGYQNAILSHLFKKKKKELFPRYFSLILKSTFILVVFIMLYFGL